MGMNKAKTIMLLGLGFGLGAVVLLIPGRRVAAAGVAAVKVINTPLSVQDVVNQPFEAQCNGQFLSSSEAQCQVAVPAGKQLVIETVTGRVSVPVGVKVRDFTLTSTGGGAFVQNSFVTTFMATDVAEDVFALAQPARIYVDQKTSILLSVICNGKGPGVASVTLSGHLVNVP